MEVFMLKKDPMGKKLNPTMTYKFNFFRSNLILCKRSINLQQKNAKLRSQCRLILTKSANDKAAAQQQTKEANKEQVGTALKSNTVPDEAKSVDIWQMLREMKEHKTADFAMYKKAFRYCSLHADSRLAIEVYEMGRCHPKLFDDINFHNIFFWCLNQQRQALQSLEIFNRLMHELPHIKPDVATFRTLMKGCKLQQMTNQAVTLLGLMKWKYSLDPTVIDYTYVLEMCANMRDLESGEKVIIQILSQQKANAEFCIDAAAMHAMLKLYAECKQVDKMMNIFLHCPNQGSWNIVHLVTMVGGFLKARRPRDALLLCEQTCLEQLDWVNNPADVNDTDAAAVHSFKTIQMLRCTAHLEIMNTEKHLHFKQRQFHQRQIVKLFFQTFVLLSNYHTSSISKRDLLVLVESFIVLYRDDWTKAIPAFTKLTTLFSNELDWWDRSHRMIEFKRTEKNIASFLILKNNPTLGIAKHLQDEMMRWKVPIQMTEISKGIWRLDQKQVLEMWEKFPQSNASFCPKNL
ncbi:pentatricopeptide repeat-containing protein [Reticulomyxa filosa]|uniref:Pentatricopeptide repeat-containing protein n=1 Tax=Reticulomyxa filosa TaxID=46433 RepID=X6P1T8_RETFI|nr:pentatricopeptide repeat-containing protein [Reticulomyxa filosa]|eukprot:ETO31517.1 pentatricopeptide repeat-containing protein [Reticulomyxa filosa]